VVAHLAERPMRQHHVVHRVVYLTPEVAADPIVVASPAKRQPLNQAVRDIGSDGAFAPAAPVSEQNVAPPSPAFLVPPGDRTQPAQAAR